MCAPRLSVGMPLACSKNIYADWQQRNSQLQQEDVSDLRIVCKVISPGGAGKPAFLPGHWTQENEKLTEQN